MSDTQIPAPQPTDQTPAPTVEQPSPAQEQAPATPPVKPETDWKAEARKWETRAKENNAAAKRLAEIEEASKSEAQKQAEAFANLQAENARLQAEALRSQVAATKGVPADLLAGTTEEELTRQLTGCWSSGARPHPRRPLTSAPVTAATPQASPSNYPVPTWPA